MPRLTPTITIATITHALKKLLITTLLTTRLLFGPIKCSFAIGCTTYAVIQIQEKPFAHALLQIIKRLLACTFPFVKFTI